MHLLMMLFLNISKTRILQPKKYWIKLLVPDNSVLFTNFDKTVSKHSFSNMPKTSIDTFIFTVNLQAKQVLNGLYKYTSSGADNQALNYRNSIAMYFCPNQVARESK
ncbi:hypothetical protein BDF19DRAFT_294447 [Syncephalis fuscata]|nr:hypothetical protein BDF19DRAFT_294447 [Syncephalis fuscata]